MATDRIIPNRPIPDESKIPATDKDLISYVVAMGVPNQVAYARFHPEFLDASGKLNKTGRGACTQFFTYAKNKEYADAYRQTLAKFIGKGSGISTPATEDISESKVDWALKELSRQAISLLEKGGELEADTVKTIVEVFKKMNLLKDDVAQEMRPIRVLPSRCKSECRYRAFVETNVAEGRIFDDCEYCRARAYAEERGFIYDPCKLLDVPQDVIDEIDSKNNIRLEDIISGKVEN